MIDHALADIESAPAEDINFSWLRSTFMRDHDLKDALDYGHAVPDTAALLDQYLYTYGPMIESQWECVDFILEDMA